MPPAGPTCLRRKGAVCQRLLLALQPRALQRLGPPGARHKQPILHRQARGQALPAGRPPGARRKRALLRAGAWEMDAEHALNATSSHACSSAP